MDCPLLEKVDIVRVKTLEMDNLFFLSKLKIKFSESQATRSLECED